MVRIRRDIASFGEAWPETLIWYAKAVRQLRSLDPNNRNSWAYLGAIHGIDRQGWIDDGVITAQSPMPPQSEQDRMWNQCQHGTWYFLPWHRGYCWSFEQIIGATVEALGGPSDWGLPYWNYLDATNPDARDIPAAFMSATMPDGSDNPLHDAKRNGLTRLGPSSWYPRDIDLSCMNQKYYTSAVGSLGFGGGVTAFNHFSGPTGACEGNPHNPVHVMIGGLSPMGWMADPNYAALDPIFWTHHCNIDRLWAAWLTVPGNVQETGANWADGPSPRQFEMPTSAGQTTVFVPGQTLPGMTYAPTYDDLTRGTGIGAGPLIAKTVLMEGIAMGAEKGTEGPPPSTLVGSSTESLSTHANAATTAVAMAQGPEMLAKSFEPSRLFLNLEHVRGETASSVLNVYIGLPDGHRELADTLALFGLQKASQEDGDHAGNGLTYTIDITGPANKLIASHGATLDMLEVTIEQPEEAKAAPVPVERISIYRQPAR